MSFGHVYFIFADDNLNFEHSEDEVKRYIFQILSGLKLLHDRNLNHKNITTETVMYDFDIVEQKIILKLDDYFFAPALNDQVQSRATNNDLEFSAPEVLNSTSNGLPADIWSVGVLTFLMLSGLSPFRSLNTKTTIHNILNANYKLDIPELETISLLAKDFMRRLLNADPSKRLTVNEALRHGWFVIKPEIPDIPEIPKPRSASRIYLATSDFSHAVGVNELGDHIEFLKDDPPPNKYDLFPRKIDPSESMLMLKQKASDSDSITQLTDLHSDPKPDLDESLPTQSQSNSTEDDGDDEDGGRDTEPDAQLDLPEEKVITLPPPASKIIRPSDRINQLAQAMKPKARKEEDALPRTSEHLTEAFLRLNDFYVLRKIEQEAAN